MTNPTISFLTFRPSANTTTHWGPLTHWPRYLVLFLFYFNTFIFLPLSIALVTHTYKVFNEGLGTSPPLYPGYDWNYCDGPCGPDEVGAFMAGPAVWVLLTSVVDVVLLTRFTLHSSYTLTVTLITWMGLVATIPISINAFAWVPENMPGDSGFYGVTAAAGLLIIVVYFVYFVLSCIGVHKHIAHKKQQKKAQLIASIRKEIVEARDGDHYADVERQGVVISN